MNNTNAQTILEFLEGKVEYKVSGTIDINVGNIKSTTEATKESLTFISTDNPQKQELYNTCKGGIIICDSFVSLDDTKCLNIIVKDPKVIFSKIANHFFVTQPKSGFHQSAVIHSLAKIDKSCYVGPGCVLGSVEIGEGSVINANTVIHDNVIIGKNVIIESNVTIGSDGFGFNRDENNTPIQFPHVGRVLIGDNVYIGANTCVDRGALGDTVLAESVKIDNHVHVAHNVQVGKNSYIIANSMIGGSTIIGENSYIAPSCSIRDRVLIGDNVVIGMASIVTKDVPSNQIWMGCPAKFYKENI